MSFGRSLPGSSFYVISSRKLYFPTEEVHGIIMEKGECGVEIVAVTEQNISNAGWIHSKSWKESHQSFCSPEFVEKHSAEAQTAYLRREIADGKQVYMLVDGSPVGIVSVQDSLIENLYILPRKQNRGYGTRLLEFAVSQCQSLPTLWILSNNEAAYRLYTRYGFWKTGSRKQLKDDLYELELKLHRRGNMKIECVWEHNGNDTLLYAVNLPGAYARGASKETAMEKMAEEVRSYLQWRGDRQPESLTVEIVQDAACTLEVRDADSDVLFDAEKAPLTYEEYEELKALALKSAGDFLKLYQSIPDKHTSSSPIRKTFYGQVPRTAEEMYQHTKSVNAYYFGEIEVDADNEGTILDCRRRGFEAMEAKPGFLENPVIEGSYGENWTLRKMLRRFLWHDRIHARAMYRMVVREFGAGAVPNIFCF